MNDDTEKKVSFLPFHAINEFMTHEYRLEVVRSTLMALPNMPEAIRDPIERAIKKFVQIAGFRNSAKAPVALKIRPAAEAFEKSPVLVAAVLAAWSEVHLDLKQRIFDLLSELGWEILPLDTDRSRLPGFLTVWPKDQDFEVLNKAYTERFPEFPAESNDIALMCVWISNRLPYQFSEVDQSNSHKTESQ